MRDRERCTYWTGQPTIRCLLRNGHEGYHELETPAEKHDREMKFRAEHSAAFEVYHFLGNLDIEDICSHYASNEQPYIRKALEDYLLGVRQDSMGSRFAER